MALFLEVATGVLAAALLLVATLAMFVGLVAGFGRERVERCPHCQHFGLTTGGLMHDGGCPVRHGAVIETWLKSHRHYH